MAENARGLAESRTLVALEATELPRPQQHLSSLSALKRATFGGGLSCAAYIGSQLSSTVKGLRGLGVIAANPSRERA